MPAVIFSGNEVKALKAALNLNDAAKILTGTDDPRSVAQDAPAGSLYIRTSTAEIFKKLDAGSTTNWEELGTGGQAGVNYVDNADFEVDTSGWTTYDDGAVATPVDGTGGAPSVVSINRTTTAGEILRGVASLEIAKSAADGQGEGTSVDLLDTDPQDSDQSKRLQLSFDYQSSANYASGDLTMHVYDIDGAALVAVQDLSLEATGGEKRRYTSSFQTVAGNNSYRVIFHVATTNATAWDVQIDNVKVSPDVLVPGAIVQGWRDFTPTGSWSTNTTYTGQYKRVGDTMDFRVKIALAGAPTATTLSVDIPLGLTIDTAKLAGEDQNSLGRITMHDSGTTHLKGEMTYGSSTSLNARYYQDDADANNSLRSSAQISATAPITFGTGDEIFINIYDIPILEWSVGAAFSTSEANLQISKASAQRNSNQSIADNTLDTVIWNQENYDTAAAYNVSTGEYTVPAGAGGKWHIDCKVAWDNVAWDAGEDIFHYIYVNGVRVRRLDFWEQQTTNTQNITTGGSTDLELVAGDVVTIRVIQRRGAATNIVDGEDGSYFNIHRIADFDTFSVFGENEFLATTSTPFDISLAAYASGEWALMAGNSVNLTPGTWQLHGHIAWVDGSATGITLVSSRWSTANGDNTSSTPPSPTLDAGVADTIERSAELDDADLPVTPIRVTVTANTTIFLVGRVFFTGDGAGSATIGTSIYAERIA